MLDQVLADSEYLVHAVPRSLAPYLGRAVSESARLTAAVYRTGLALHAIAAPAARRQILALDAARAGASALRGDMAARTPPGQWVPIWATGSTFTAALRDTYAADTQSVSYVACGIVDEVPVAVTSGYDELVRVWDLRTGQPHGEPVNGRAGARPIAALPAYKGQYRPQVVGCTVLGGAPVAITLTAGEIQVWNLRTQALLGPFTYGAHRISAATCTQLEGTPAVIVSIQHEGIQA